MLADWDIMILFNCTSPLSSLSLPRGERRFVGEVLSSRTICWCSRKNRLDVCLTSPFSGPSSTSRPNVFSAFSGSLPLYVVKMYERYCMTALFFTFFLVRSWPKWFLEGFAQAASPKAQRQVPLWGVSETDPTTAAPKMLLWTIPLSLGSREDVGML